MASSDFAFAMDPALSLTAAVAVAGILIASAVPKLQAMAYFEGIVVDYQILPEAPARWFARTLPWLELLVALALIPPLSRSLAAGVAAVLVCAFAVGVAVNLLRGRNRMDCGCSALSQPAAGETLSWPLLGRNVFLLVLLAMSAGVDSGRALRALQWVDAMSVIFGSAALLGLYLAADQLLANLPRLYKYRSL